MAPADSTLAVERAIESRRSVRAFLDTPVPRELLRRLLELAARAPSGTNTQPWQVHVVIGAARDRLVAEACRAFDEGRLVARDDYYPKEFFEPYLSRRRALGWAMYGLVGIVKGDKEGMRRQTRRNFELFGAPVGLMFTLHRDLGWGSHLDLGMFMENLMIAARGHGLDTCPQAAWREVEPVVRDLLTIPPEQKLVCGMALGYAAMEAPVNRLVTDRVPVEEFAVFHAD